MIFSCQRDLFIYPYVFISLHVYIGLLKFETVGIKTFSYSCCYFLFFNISHGSIVLQKRLMIWCQEKKCPDAWKIVHSPWEIRRTWWMWQSLMSWVGKLLQRSSSVILATCRQAVSSWQNVAEQYHPSNIWPSSIIQETCGRAVSSGQHVAEQCHPGNMWPSSVILATCGWALSNWEIMTKLE